jgi:hypothetical protein
MRTRRLGVVLAVVALGAAALGAAAGAAAGDAMLLGRFNNAQRAKTTLWANANGAALHVKQARPGEAALKLENDGTAAPLWVNSDGLVDRLNADEVDGYDAGDLIRADWCMMDREGMDHHVGDFNCPMDIVAPTAGVLLMSGSVDLSKGATGDLLMCRFDVNGTEVAGTQRTQDLHTTHDQESNCSSDGALVVPAGAHHVVFKVMSVHATRVFDVTSYVMFVPFGGDGTPIGG